MGHRHHDDGGLRGHAPGDGAGQGGWQRVRHVRHPVPGPARPRHRVQLHVLLPARRGQQEAHVFHVIIEMVADWLKVACGSESRLSVGCLLITADFFRFFFGGHVEA